MAFAVALQETQTALLEAHEWVANLPVKHDGGPAGSTRNRPPRDEENPPDDIGPSGRQQLQSTAQHAALVERLQDEFLASDLEPPADSIKWTSETLSQWFEDGGVLTYRALRLDVVRAINIDSALGELPHVELPLFDCGPGGLMTALRQQRGAVFDDMAARLARDGWVAVDAGLPAALLAMARDEGERASPLMRAGQVTRRSDGKKLTGISPSGAPRGDRYILADDLPNGAAAWPALTALDALVRCFGSAMAPGVREERILGYEMVGASPSMVARFAGDGLGYGCHLDGDGDVTKITMILYTSSGWQPSHAGQLCMLDENKSISHRCWRSLPPREGTLVAFRSDIVVHKVMPSFATRLALTCFFSGGRDSSRQVLSDIGLRARGEDRER